MKRIWIFLTLMYTICLSVWLWGCKQDASTTLLEQFIAKQVACETYQLAQGDEEVLKNSFSEFFTQESYQKYLDDVVGYMYPQLYYQTNAKEVNLKHIKHKDVTKNQDQSSTYTFEVEYQIISAKQDGKKVEKIGMKDQTQITIDKNNKIISVILLNTSDIIAKLFLDIKVQ